MAASNTVEFSVAAADLSGPPETSLRPQLAVLAVTRAATPALAPTLSLAVETNQVELTIAGEVNRTYTVWSSTNLIDWSEAGSLVSTNAVSRWSVSATNNCRFFRVQAQ